MIAARLSAVWQVAGVAGAALVCYLVSQSVASERAALARVERQIADTQDDIRRLNTEIGARGRMVQLQRWNRDVLALQAPRPRQFVADGVQLASLYGRRGQPALPLNPAITGQVAATAVAYQGAPPAPVAAPPTVQQPAAPEQPLLRTATYVRAHPSPLAPEAAPIARVSYTRPAPTPTVRAELVEGRAPGAALAARPSTSLGTNGEGKGDKAKDAKAADKRPAGKAEKAVALHAVRAEPVAARSAQVVFAARPSTSLRANGDGVATPGASKAAATKPAPARKSLLPSDIGALAAAESRPRK